MCVWPLMLSRARAACAAPVEVKKGGKQMEKTNREYRAEPARVERTLQRFTKMTLHELKAVQQKKRNYAEWCMAWIPTQMELENYSQSIMRAYRLVERLLVRSFRLAFPEQFYMDRIRTRYAQDHKTA